jgi:hypothetical protein
MFDISNELSTKQDGSVFIPVRFLFPLSLPPVNEWINLNVGFKFEVRYVLLFASMIISSKNNNF